MQVRPGTDAALALGMMHVIIRDGLHDAEYVAREHRRVRAARRASRASTLRSVSSGSAASLPTTIEQVAREYATTRPAFIRIGNGLQHHDNGGMAVRTIACLPGLVGAWRDVGGGAMKSNGGYAAMNDAALMRPDLLGWPECRGRST